MITIVCESGVYNPHACVFNSYLLDDGGFATEQKRTVGIAIVSCAAALVVIIITIFTILACSRERGKETDSQSGLVNESSRVQDNENNLFRRTNRRFSMSML